MAIDQKRNPMELLAPAGDWEAFRAALAAGADAVYLGGKMFNARQSAANFDLDQLKKAADLLHLHGKKLYITVNTLINDNEMAAALDYLAELYRLSVDAVIVQDMGLIAAARQALPELELHASTQMTVHNTEGALLLKKAGIKRVVLARELTAAEVEAIARNSGLEIEVFVHGALCVCYSGQCLMSSMIGGRSGNRGRCAQPCRMEYQLFRDGKAVPSDGNYLLSPKDLSLISMLPQLLKAGVHSLKIEGRMKRPEYVYNVTRVYREALDALNADPAAFRAEAAWFNRLEETFNRSFTTGYFGNNRNKALMSFTRPNNRGLYLGRVKQVDSAGVTLRLETELQQGDEIEIWVSKGGRATATIGQMFVNGTAVNAAAAGTIVRFPVAGKVYPGDRVFKVFSSQVAEATRKALDPDNPALKIPCWMHVTGKSGEPLILDCRDDQGNQVAVTSEIPLQTAKNRPLTAEVLREQLGRLGNTPFYLADVRCELEGQVMLPLSALNQLRREAIDQLVENRLKSYTHKDPIPSVHLDAVEKVPVEARDSLRQPQLSVWAADLDGVYEAALAGADLIYAGGDELTGFQWDQAAFSRAVAMAHEAGARLVVGLPRINRETHRSLWESYPEYARKAQADGIIVSDLGGWEMVQSQSDLPIYLNYTLNFFNQWAFKFITNERIRQITLSPELTLNQIAELAKGAPVPLECLIHGPLELMVSEYCPIGSLEMQSGSCSRACRKHSFALRDRMQLDFPVVTDQFCRMHLLNSKDLCLYGDLERLLKLPLMLRLELKIYTPPQTAAVVNAYRYAIHQGIAGKKIDDVEGIMEQFKRLTGRGITKGHFFRGVE
ncbi:MAG TPA: DUF3656 domain-containing protein [Bacillota bacterium]|nr:DUF3656 domain-containing protein [Bacillota bacterium]HPT87510.1 DUF3656 domain-containing protein [Bacillota bacterium]